MAWLIRWVLSGMVKDPPSMDAILGKEQEPELDIEAFSSLLKKINQKGKWDA